MSASKAIPCHMCFARLLQFGDSQQLRMVRILRSTLMVRVGGGWTALDEFLVKNDPCRGRLHHSTLNFHSQTHILIIRQAIISCSMTSLQHLVCSDACCLRYECLASIFLTLVSYYPTVLSDYCFLKFCFFK